MANEFDNETHEMSFWCDNCPESEVFFLGPYAEFRDLIEIAKEKGWKIFKDGDEWVHYCKNCRRKVKYE